MGYLRELPDRTLLKPSQVASLFNVSPQTVYFWHRTGMIEGIKIGGRILRIFASSLEERLDDETWILVIKETGDKQGKR